MRDSIIQVVTSLHTPPRKSARNCVTRIQYRRSYNTKSSQNRIQPLQNCLVVQLFRSLHLSSFLRPLHKVRMQQAPAMLCLQIICHYSLFLHLCERKPLRLTTIFRFGKIRCLRKSRVLYLLNVHCFQWRPASRVLLTKIFCECKNTGLKPQPRRECNRPLENRSP